MSNLMHKITVDQASLYFETKDVSKLTHKLFKKSFELKFVNQFNQMFSGVDTSDMLADKAYQLTMQNRAYNLYYSLHEGLRCAMQCDGNKDGIAVLGKLMEGFKELFGREFKGIEDLKIIRSQIDHFKDKYEDTFDVKENKDEFNFEQMIYFVETVSASRIDRDILLFQFNNYLQNAIKDARRNSKVL